MGTPSSLSRFANDGFKDMVPQIRQKELEGGLETQEGFENDCRRHKESVRTTKPVILAAVSIQMSPRQEVEPQEDTEAAD